MKILVDADACPVKGIIVREARRRKIAVTMLIDTSHELDDGYSEVVTVDKGADSVDYALIGMTSCGDVVVTQDYGLAAMALAKGARVVNQNGLIYTDDNIDGLLADRYVGQKVRRHGGRTKGPPKRTQCDDDKFAAALGSLLG
ncbi:MAG: YaiI/YqxD family protein [Synergistaceae bacterium]|nr:YaiI/YqxD family protein [Synergistaceae bacterium]